MGRTSIQTKFTRKVHHSEGVQASVLQAAAEIIVGAYLRSTCILASC